MRHSVWRLPSIATLVLAIFSLSAAAQTCVVPNPDMQSGDKVNLRAQPTTQSRILAQLAGFFGQTRELVSRSAFIWRPPCGGIYP